MKNLSIRKKYFYYITLVCIISLAIVSVISYYISYQLVLKSKLSEVKMEAQRYCSEIDSWLALQTNTLNHIQEDIIINSEYYNSTRLKNMLQKRYELANGQVNDYYIGKPDKNMISGCGYQPAADYDCTSRNWYKQAAQSKAMVYTLPYVDTYTGKLVFTMSEPLIKGEQFKGVLAADITMDYLMKLVNQIKVAKHGYAFLIDSRKNILTYPQKSYLPTAQESYQIDQILGGRLKPLADQMDTESYGLLKLKDYDNSNKYFYTKEISSTKWVMVLVFPADGVTSGLRQLLLGFVIAFIISIGISLIVIYFFNLGMLRPVMHLTGIVKQFGEKNMDVRCEINSRDEVGELGKSFNRMADMIQDYSTNLEHEVQERTRELVEKNARIQDSIEYARRIQQTILPENRLGEVLKDYFIIWHPRDIVGGDFYWMRKFDGGFLIIVGDCTGHGVPGALMTMAVNSMLDRIVDDICHDNPAFILNKLNELLKESLHTADNSIQDGLDAGAICVFDDGTIVYSGAGISLFIIQNEETTEIKGINHTIGNDLKKKHFENQPIKFAPGMSFYLATDGVKDQVGGEKRLPFGKRGMLAVLKTIQQYSMEEQKNIIWTAYEDYKKNEPLRDDVTMFGFRL